MNFSSNGMNFLRDLNHSQILESIKQKGSDIIRQKQKAPTPPLENSLMDRSAVVDADSVIVDCEAFLSRQLQEPSRQSVMLDKFKKMSGGNKDPSSSQVDVLVARLCHSENLLKSSVSEAVEEESSFTLQALHLSNRVKSCLRFNQQLVPNERSDMQVVFGLQHEVETGLASLAAMIKFQNELVYMRESHYRYVPKALRLNDTEQRQQEEQLMIQLKTRQKKLQRVSDKLGRHIATLSKTHRTHELNLSNLSYSHNVLMGILAKQGFSADEIASQKWMSDASPRPRRRADDDDVEEEKGEKEGPELVDNSSLDSLLDGGVDGKGGGGAKAVIEGDGDDHSYCGDCSCVHAMVTECVMQLAAKTLQAEENTRRLQRILELRSRMLDCS